MKKYEKFKIYFEDNKFYILYHLIGYLATIVIFDLFLENFIQGIAFSTIIWSFIIYPFNIRWNDKYPIFDGKLEDDEEILLEEKVFFLFKGYTRHTMIITNKSLIFKNFFKMKRSDIKILIKDLGLIEANKYGLVISIKFYNDLIVKVNNSERIKNLILELKQKNNQKAIS